MQPNAFFVYGTLKSGNSRAKAWPHPPSSIQIGYTQAKLFDLGPYPALAEGEDWVQGELWQFEPQFVPDTTQALDEVEGYYQSPDDLYDRRTIQVVLENGEIHSAFSYFFRRWKSTRASPVQPEHPLPLSLLKSLETTKQIPMAQRLYAVWLPNSPESQRDED